MVSIVRRSASKWKRECGLASCQPCPLKPAQTQSTARCHARGAMRWAVGGFAVVSRANRLYCATKKTLPHVAMREGFSYRLQRMLQSLRHTYFTVATKVAPLTAE
jgi:hypothetical protein